ncbi:unnamed protein product [Penicillium roqueforti FM164]|uniref:Genomic scaffold, ProqFM164S03 n=1 Tax=Penicillium roqueforti (strain FM164) TaxID=1365484 RepID=W6QC47_PENRF|nr:unnamed protein product [Penicillium roqueforti FM164]
MDSDQNEEIHSPESSLYCQVDIDRPAPLKRAMACHSRTSTT